MKIGEEEVKEGEEESARENDRGEHGEDFREVKGGFGDGEGMGEIGFVFIKVIAETKDGSGENVDKKTESTGDGEVFEDVGDDNPEGDSGVGG